MVTAVIDGMGGGIGTQIVTQLRQELTLEVEILALGNNAIAAEVLCQHTPNLKFFRTLPQKGLFS
jgi:hypothetical protein